MRKRFLFLFLAFILFFFAGCNFPATTNVEIDRIEIDTSAVPTEARVGEIDVKEILQNIRIIVYKTDGSEEIIKTDESMISKEDIEKLNSVGIHVIEINYNGFNASFEITIKDDGRLAYSCEVIFYDYNNNVISNIKIDENTKMVEFPNVEDIEGLRFKGWSLDSNAIMNEVLNQVQVIHVYAEYERFVSWTVSFADMDGVIYQELEINTENPLIEFPAIAYIEGYSFMGWSMTLEEINNSFADVTVYALYEPNNTGKTKEVTFLLPDGYFIKTIVINEEDEKIEFPNVLDYQEGYIFVGWSMTEEEILKSKTDVEVYAVFEEGISLYIMNFRGQVVYSKVFKPGEFTEFPKMDDLVDGFRFTGFDMTLEEINNSRGIVHVYAMYELVGIFKLHFYDFYNNLIDVIDYQQGDEVNVSIPDVDGYTFMGWDFDFDQVNEDSFIYPIYKMEGEDNSFSIIFEGLSIEPYSLTTKKLGPILKGVYSIGQEVTLPIAPVIDGYMFICWDISYSKLPYINSDTKINALYAKVDEVKPTHKLTIYGLNNVLIREMYICPEYSNLFENVYRTYINDMPYKKGYDFTGWDKDMNDIFSSTNDLSIYAKYEPNGESTECKIVFYGFEFEVLSELFVTDRSQIVFPEPPKVPGYVFEKWQIDEIELINLSYDLNIYPLYTKVEEPVIQLKLIFKDFNDTTFSEMYFDDNFSFPEAPIVDGYKFYGYNKVYEDLQIAKNEKRDSIEIKAIYCVEASENTFNVIFTSGVTGAIINVSIYPEDYFTTNMYPEVSEYSGYEFSRWNYTASDINEMGKTTKEFYVNAIYHRIDSSVVEHRINFYNYYNELFDVRYYEEGANVIYPDPPNIKGMTFVGWSKDVNVLTQDEDVKAIYEITPTRVIKFFGKDGELIKELKLYGENPVVLEYPNAPEYDKFVFAGWDYSIEAVNRTSYINEVKALYREMSENTIHRVTFLDKNGHYHTSFDIKYGEEFALPNGPEMSYLIFAGWDKTLEEMMNTYLDVYVSPIYRNPYNYTVTFLGMYDDLLNERIYSELTIKDIVYPIEQFIMGYEFVGWSIEKEELINNFNSNVTIKAIYKQRATNLKFVTEFGEVLEEFEYYAGNDVDYPNPLTQVSNMKFEYWSHTIEGIKSSAKQFANLEVTAYFKEYKTVSFYSKNGDLIETRDVFADDEEYPEAPVVYGYDFVNWSPTIKELFENDLDPVINATYKRTNFFLGKWYMDNVISPFIHGCYILEINEDYLYYNGIKAPYNIDDNDHHFAHTQMYYLDGLVDVELEFSDGNVIVRGLDSNYTFYETPMLGGEQLELIQISEAISLSREEAIKYRDEGKRFRIYGVVTRIQDSTQSIKVVISDEYGSSISFDLSKEYVTLENLSFEIGQIIYVNGTFDYKNNASVFISNNTYQIVYSRVIPQFFINVYQLDKDHRMDMIERIILEDENNDREYTCDYEFVGKNHVIEIVDLSRGYINHDMTYDVNINDFYKITYQKDYPRFYVDKLDFTYQYNKQMFGYVDDGGNTHSYYFRVDDNNRDIEYYYNEELVGNNTFEYIDNFKAETIIDGATHIISYNIDGKYMSVNEHKLTYRVPSYLICRIKFYYDLDFVYETTCRYNESVTDIPSLSIIAPDDERMFIGWAGNLENVHSDQAIYLEYIKKSVLDPVVGTYEEVIDGKPVTITLNDDYTFVYTTIVDDNKYEFDVTCKNIGYYEYDMTDKDVSLYLTKTISLDPNEVILYEYDYNSNHLWGNSFDANGYSLKRYDWDINDYRYYINNEKEYPNNDYYLATEIDHYNGYGNEALKFHLSYNEQGYPVYKLTINNEYYTIYDESAFTYTINYKENESDTIRHVFITYADINSFYGLYKCPNGLVTIIYDPIINRISYEIHSIEATPKTIEEILQMDNEALNASNFVEFTATFVGRRDGYIVLSDGVNELLVNALYERSLFTSVQLGQDVTVVATIEKITIGEDEVNVCSSVDIKEAHEFNIDLELLCGTYITKSTEYTKYTFTVNSDGSARLYEVRNNQDHIKDGYIVNNRFVVTLYEYKDKNYVISRREGTIESPVESNLLYYYGDYVTMLSTALYRSLPNYENCDYYLYLEGSDINHYIDDCYKLQKQNNGLYVIEAKLQGEGYYHIVRHNRITNENSIIKNATASVDKPAYVLIKYNEINDGVESKDLRPYYGITTTIKDIQNRKDSFNEELYKDELWRVEGNIYNIIERYQGRFTITDGECEILIENILPSLPNHFFHENVVRGMHVIVTGRTEKVDDKWVIKDASFEHYHILSDKEGYYISEDGCSKFEIDYLSSNNVYFYYTIERDGYIELYLNGRISLIDGRLYAVPTTAYSLISGNNEELDPNDYIKEVKWQNGMIIYDNQELTKEGGPYIYTLYAYDYDTNELLGVYLYRYNVLFDGSAFKGIIVKDFDDREIDFVCDENGVEIVQKAILSSTNVYFKFK